MTFQDLVEQIKVDISDLGSEYYDHNNADCGYNGLNDAGLEIEWERKKEKAIEIINEL